MRFTYLVLIFLVFIIGCGNDEKADVAKSAKTELKESVAVESLSVAIDPVCGMMVTQANLAGTVTYEGKTFGFCSAICKEAFEQDPASFLAKMQEMPADSSHRHDSM